MKKQFNICLISAAGSLKFKTAEWINKVEPCANINLELDGNKFRVSRDEAEGSPVKLNGFPVTVDEYQKALDGEIVTLRADDAVAKLTSADGTVTLDGKPLTNIKQITISQSGQKFIK